MSFHRERRIPAAQTASAVWLTHDCDGAVMQFRKISLFPPGKVPYFSVQCLLVLRRRRRKPLKHTVIECGGDDEMLEKITRVADDLALFRLFFSSLPISISSSKRESLRRIEWNFAHVLVAIWYDVSHQNFDKFPKLCSEKRLSMKRLLFLIWKIITQNILRKIIRNNNIHILRK